MKMFTYIFRLQVLGIISVYVRDNRIENLPVFDTALITDRLVGFPKIVGLHANPWQKYLADVGTINKAENLGQFFQSKICI